jgi:hypothetical protein
MRAAPLEGEGSDSAGWTLPASLKPLAALEERLVLPGEEAEAVGAEARSGSGSSRGSYAFYVHARGAEYSFMLNRVMGALYYHDGGDGETAEDFATRARTRRPSWKPPTGRKRKRGEEEEEVGEAEEEEEMEEDEFLHQARYLDHSAVPPWRRVGTLEGTMIDRPSHLFQEMSDNVSQELYDTCRATCGDRGILRYDDIDGLERFADRAASLGYMLHIEKVEIDKVGLYIATNQLLHSGETCIIPVERSV